MLLTTREKTRIEAVQAVMDGRLSVAEAAQVLNLSERQLYRSLAAAGDEGLTGLVHGKRGRKLVMRESVERVDALLEKRAASAADSLKLVKSE